MIGYCATANNGIAIAPTRQMNSATTQAKIGLSMKKTGMGYYRCACVVCLTLGPVCGAASADASASVQACGLTLSPATNF